MIISSSGRFVFMHNPKVAGSSVRDALEPFRNPGTNIFGEDLDPTSPCYGVDQAHIGIDEFSKWFPDLWGDAKDYTYFALYRDPHARFLSSVNEYSRVYGDRDIRFASIEQRYDFLQRTIDMLAQKKCAEHTLDTLELTHFRPQWIYLSSPNLPQAQIRTYDLKNFRQFAADLSHQTGTTVEFARENSSEQFELGNLGNRLLSNNALKKTLRRVPGSMLAMRALRSSARSQTTSKALSVTERYGLSAQEESSLNQFIKDFYAQDFNFLARLEKPAPMENASA